MTKHWPESGSNGERFPRLPCWPSQDQLTVPACAAKHMESNTCPYIINGIWCQGGTRLVQIQTNSLWISSSQWAEQSRLSLWHSVISFQPTMLAARGILEGKVRVWITEAMPDEPCVRIGVCHIWSVQIGTSSSYVLMMQQKHGKPPLGYSIVGAANYLHCFAWLWYTRECILEMFLHSPQVLSRPMVPFDLCLLPAWEIVCLSHAVLQLIHIYRKVARSKRAHLSVPSTLTQCVNRKCTGLGVEHPRPCTWLK